MSSLPVEAAFLLVAGLAFVVRQDVVERRIGNGSNLALAAFGLVAWAARGSGLDGVVTQSAPGLVLCLAIGFGAFALGWIGGGDAKLLAAMGAWVGLSSVLSLIVFTALAGGVVSAATLLAERRSGRPRGSSRGVPYGIAIAAGTLCTICVGIKGEL